MVEVHKLDTYVIQKEDKFFFDTNVWMYIHCSIANHNESVVKKYSDFYQKIRLADAEILTSTLLISEFVNTYSRLEFNLIKKDHKLRDFKKDFRSNQKYKKLLDNINLVTEKKILNKTLKIQDDFHEFKEDIFFSNPNQFDFNDEYFCYLAEKNGFKIVTNDKDFLNSTYSIDVITI